MKQHLVRTLAVLSLAAAATSLGAQETKKPVPAMDHAAHDQHAKPALDAELAGHFKGIELTDEQVKRIVESKAKHHKAMDALKKEAKDQNDPALKAALQKHMDAEHAEFKSLLTPEQHKVFEENMKGHHRADAGAEKHDMKHGEKPAAKPEAKKPF